MGLIFLLIQIQIQLINFLISNFFINKSSQGRKSVRKKSTFFGKFSFTACCWKWYNYELRKCTYLSCSYNIHIFSTNLHTCSQNLIANCPVLGLVGMRRGIFKIFFFLRYAIFLARLNNFQSVSMRTFC